MRSNKAMLKVCLPEDISDCSLAGSNVLVEELWPFDAQQPGPSSCHSS